MQVPGPFEYERATGVDHAIGLLDRLGEEARIIAGGHSLLPMMKLRLANPEYLIDINDLAAELGYIVTDPTLVRIGAMVRHRHLLESDDLAAVCPIFRDAERVIADPVVRNRGTIGGSLCQADPAEDLTTVCTVLGATCLVRGPSGDREIAMDGFLVGPYETAMSRNELLLEIRIPVRHRTSSAYAKVERRVGDWAIAAAGATVTLRDGTIAAARIGLTAVDPDPAALAASVDDVLIGEPPTEEVFSEAGRRASAACSPVSDARGSADYKRHLASVLTIRALRTAAERVLNHPALKGN
ncbi:FAD binding domain-containing protein [Nocardia amamiensis]|uniref:FAD binding domain-containing protein n=1 Tax=Nocardia amamiensis TaxID=404578 RepID=UPI00082ADEBE|nr:xanthine dehydrogenase family protein subunit M [Nocardia amamiensis]